MNTNNSASFKRGLVILLSLLFILTLGAMIIVPVIFGGEAVEPWMVIVNTLLLAVPIALLYTLIGILSMGLYRHRHAEHINPRLAAIIYWSPRIGCILLVAFMSLFALDSFQAGRTMGENLFAFLMHMLPMLALAGVLAAAWRWPWVGAALFGLAALAFLVQIFTNGFMGLSTFLIFGAPLLMIALLFAANARWKQELDAARHLSLPAR